MQVNGRTRPCKGPQAASRLRTCRRRQRRRTGRAALSVSRSSRDPARGQPQARSGGGPSGTVTMFPVAGACSRKPGRIASGCPFESRCVPGDQPWCREGAFGNSPYGGWPSTPVDTMTTAVYGGTGSHETLELLSIQSAGRAAASLREYPWYGTNPARGVGSWSRLRRNRGEPLKCCKQDSTMLRGWVARTERSRCGPAGGGIP